MSDLIRREAVLLTLKIFDYDIIPSVLARQYVREMLDTLYVKLNEIPSVEPERKKGKWIPVTERLPEKKEIVLITNNKGHVRCGQYQGVFDDKNYRWWWKHNTLEEVLAWMPLPEPYRGE